MSREPQDIDEYSIPYTRVPYMRPDNEVILLLASDYHSRRLILQALGCEHRVTLAYTALEARTLLSAYEYRLVIVTNLGMPPDHAVSVVPLDHSYPVIFMSGVFNDSLRRECTLKRIRCMKVPFKLEEFRDAVARALDEPSR